MTFNTKGQVVGENASSGKAAAAADPPLSELDALQLLLDLGGMVPGAGAIADLLNAAISAARGDWLGMALSIFSAAPAVGDAAALAKIANNGPKYVKALAVVETKVLPKLPDRMAKPLKEFIDQAKVKLDDLVGQEGKKTPEVASPNKAPAQETPKNGSQVKQKRAEQADPKCFGGSQTKKNPEEYDRQLKMQEDALNNMSVDEYLQNRDRWDQMKRLGTAAEQVKARAGAISDMAAANTAKLIRSGVGIRAAETQGRAMAEASAKGMDVLHSPDLNAGGTASGTTGLGDKGVNRSIGSNWGQNQDGAGAGERVRTIDDTARSVPKAERASTKMNVKLKRCQ